MKANSATSSRGPKVHHESKSEGSKQKADKPEGSKQRTEKPESSKQRTEKPESSKVRTEQSRSAEQDQQRSEQTRSRQRAEQIQQAEQRAGREQEKTLAAIRGESDFTEAKRDKGPVALDGGAKPQADAAADAQADRSQRDAQLADLKQRNDERLDAIRNDAQLDAEQRQRQAEDTVQTYFQDSQKLGVGYQPTGEGESVVDVAARDSGQYRVDLGADGKYNCTEASIEAQRMFARAGVDSRLDIVKNDDGTEHALLDVNGRRFDPSEALQGRNARTGADGRAVVASLDQHEVRSIFEGGGSVESARAAADRVGAGAAAEVRANQQAQARLDNPGKFGVVLNHELKEAPTAQQLADQGVTGVRISLTADNANLDQVLDPANPDEARADGVKTWNDLFASYRAKGIEVLVNLPPESVKPGYETELNWRDYATKTVIPAHDDQPEQIQYTLSEEQKNQFLARRDQFETNIATLPREQLPPEERAWLDKYNAWKESYLNRVTDVATKLGGNVDAYEISNEPDQPAPDSLVESRMPPSAYGTLLRDAYNRIKGPNDADPTAKVVVGGLDSGQPDYLAKAAAATDSVLWADKVGVHPYGTPTPENGSLQTFIQYNYGAKLREAGVMMPGQNGEPPSVPDSYPIYVTEASMPPALRAPESYMPAFAQTADDLPEIERYYMFWRGTVDAHPGLTESPEAARQLRRMLGK